MRYLLYSFLSLALLFAACEKQSLESESAIKAEMAETDGPGNDKNDPNAKITICHATGSETNPWLTIEIARSALKAHLAHGDVNPDADGDGYTAVQGPLNPCGYGTANDCDDNDASIYPGAEEVCGDGIDNDCDGTIDEGCGPVVQEGFLTTATTLGGARWRNFRTANSGWDIAVGKDIGTSGDPDWADRDFGNLYYFSPSSTPNVFSYVYNANTGVQTASATVNGGPQTATINSGNLGTADYLQISVFARTAGTEVQFKNVVLTVGANSYNLGDFIAPSGSPVSNARNWYIDGFDLSGGFSITGDVYLVGNSSNQENNRIDIRLGNTP